MKRFLIVNADDLGYTRGVNRAAAHCLDRGILRSASLLTCGDAFEDAVSIAKANRGLGVGVHLALVEFKPLARLDLVPGLADESGRMPSSPLALLASLLSGKVSAQSIRRELDLQIARALDYGIRPTHLDSHKHTHMLPQVSAIVAELAAKYSIRWVRNPFEGVSCRFYAQTIEKDKTAVFWKQYSEACASGVFRRSFHRHLRFHGLRTPDFFHGVSMTGLWNRASAIQLIERLRPGVNEWMTHPGEYDRELAGQRTRLLSSRRNEMDILTSPVLKDLCIKHDIILKHFGEDL